MKLAVITDTSAAIAEKYKKFDNLHILDIPLTIDGKTYSSKEISSDDFFDLMENSKEVPKSAQPSLVELEELLEHLKMQGYTHILGLFLPAAISGFYENAYRLQEEYSDGQVTVLFPETFITSSPLGYMVETALEAAVKNLSFDDVMANFEKIRASDTAYMLVDDLKWLSKSGRLSNGSAVLGTLFGIKPVLTFSDQGSVDLFEKIRTSKKTMARMKEILLEHSTPDDYKIYVIHSRAEERAQELYDFAAAQGYKDLEIVPFGPVIATHLGLGATAYGISPKIF
jgi:DegV family protein with EDD domain